MWAIFFWTSMCYIFCQPLGWRWKSLQTKFSGLLISFSRYVWLPARRSFACEVLARIRGWGSKKQMAYKTNHEKSKPGMEHHLVIIFHDTRLATIWTSNTTSGYYLRHKHHISDKYQLHMGSSTTCCSYTYSVVYSGSKMHNIITSCLLPL